MRQSARRGCRSFERSPLKGAGCNNSGSTRAAKKTVPLLPCAPRVFSKGGRYPWYSSKPALASYEPAKNTPWSGIPPDPAGSPPIGRSRLSTRCPGWSSPKTSSRPPRRSRKTPPFEGSGGKWASRDYVTAGRPNAIATR